MPEMKPIRRPSKADVLYATLRDLAVKLGPGARLPTIEILCRQLDVAKVTLDRALQRLASEQVLVREPRRGIFVSASIGQKTIAVVFGGDIFSASFSPFWSLLLQEVRQQALARKHRALAYLDITHTGEGMGGHEQLVEDLEKRRIHGILLLAPPSGTFKPLDASGVPWVVFGGRSFQWSVNHALNPVFTIAAKELMKRGCRRIAFVGQISERFDELLSSELKEAGYQGPSILDWSYDTWVSQFNGGMTRESVSRELVQRMIAGRAEVALPDGLLSLDDTMTRGVVQACESAGIRVGRDIHIVTIANKGSLVLEPYADNLILLEYEPAAIVRAALDMLETLMNKGTPPENRVLISPVIRTGNAS